VEDEGRRRRREGKEKKVKRRLSRRKTYLKETISSTLKSSTKIETREKKGTNSQCQLESCCSWNRTIKILPGNEKVKRKAKEMGLSNTESCGVEINVSYLLYNFLRKHNVLLFSINILISQEE
jgi:hypothetical protein